MARETMDDVRAQRDAAQARAMAAESEVVRLRAILAVIRASLAQSELDG
jgi:hypothetical protein